MLRDTPFAFGSLKGTVYDFVDANDVLPMHQHDETTVHITVVARGSFKIRGNAWERTVQAGDVIDWRPNDPHEFVALEANSRAVNILKNVGAKPDGR